MEQIVKDSSASGSLQSLETLSNRIRNKLSKKDISTSIEIKENELFHGTYLIEQQMLSYIKEGDIDGIRHLFHVISKNDDMNVGTLADNPLRQEKNIFIGLVALIGKTAAIEGGIDIEDSYRMVDVYTKECEELNSIDDIYVLRYYMIIDFTERVRAVKLPDNLSLTTLKAMHYVNEHLYSNIRLDDVAEFAGVSRSTLTKKFRLELNQSITEYATGAKIKEAQRLLLYSDMSISQIAEYLAFSSQSYFQTVFKRVTGKTPLDFKAGL